MAAHKPYVVRCSAPQCPSPALYKVAASWTDGNLVELKPYGFACAQHIRDVFQRGQQKKAQCRLSEGESLGAIEIYQLERGKHDRELLRAKAVEEKLTQQA